MTTTDQKRGTCSECGLEVVWIRGVLQCPLFHSPLPHVLQTYLAVEDEEFRWPAKTLLDNDWKRPFAGLEVVHPYDWDFPSKWWEFWASHPEFGDQFSHFIRRLEQDGHLLRLEPAFRLNGSYDYTKKKSKKRLFDLAVLLDIDIGNSMGRLLAVAALLDVDIDIGMGVDDAGFAWALQNLGDFKHSPLVFSWWATPEQWRHRIDYIHRKTWEDQVARDDELVATVSAAEDIVSLDSRLFGDKAMYKDKDEVLEDWSEQYNLAQPVRHGDLPALMEPFKEIRTQIFALWVVVLICVVAIAILMF